MIQTVKETAAARFLTTRLRTLGESGRLAHNPKCLGQSVAPASPPSRRQSPPERSRHPPAAARSAPWWCCATAGARQNKQQAGVSTGAGRTLPWPHRTHLRKSCRRCWRVKERDRERGTGVGVRVREGRGLCRRERQGRVWEAVVAAEVAAGGGGGGGAQGLPGRPAAPGPCRSWRQQASAGCKGWTERWEAALGARPLGWTTGLLARSGDRGQAHKHASAARTGPCEQRASQACQPPHGRRSLPPCLQPLIATNQEDGAGCTSCPLTGTSQLRAAPCCPAVYLTAPSCSRPHHDCCGRRGQRRAGTSRSRSARPPAGATPPTQQPAQQQPAAGAARQQPARLHLLPLRRRRAPRAAGGRCRSGRQRAGQALAPQAIRRGGELVAGGRWLGLLLAPWRGEKFVLRALLAPRALVGAPLPLRCRPCPTCAWTLLWRCRSCRPRTRPRAARSCSS